MKLEIAVLAGAESKAFLADLTKQIDRLERLGGVKPATASKAAATTDDDEEDEDFAAAPAPAKKGKAPAAKAASFEDEDEETETETETEDDADEDFTTPAPAPAPAAKKSKAKKLTIDDVSDACKARARAGGKEGRTQVLAILKKNFKTQSVTEIAEDKWPAVIKAMAV